MTSKDKLLTKFFAYPQSLKYREIEYLLLDNGFLKIVAKGSHIKFKHPLLSKDLVIPVHNNDCKIFYKKYAQKILKSLRNIE